MRINIFTTGILFVFIFFVLVIPLTAKEKIKIGVLITQGEEDFSDKAKKTVLFLNKEFPKDSFELKQISFFNLIDEVKKKSIDIVICNPSNYVLLKEKYNAKALATIENYYNNNAYDAYGRVIFTRKENQFINKLSDLKDKVLIIRDRINLNGGILINDLLNKNGLNLIRDSRSVIFSAFYDEVINSVLNGQADVGIIRTGVLEMLANKGEINLEEIKVIHPINHENHPFLCSTDLIPEWPIVKLAHFSDEKAKLIAQKLYTFNFLTNYKENTEEKFGWTLPKDYSVVAQKLKTIKAPPFDLPDHSLKNLIKSDYYFFFLTFTLIIVLILFVVFARFMVYNLKSGEKDDKNSALLESAASISGVFDLKNGFAAQCAKKEFEISSIKTSKYFLYTLIIALIYYLSIKMGFVFSISNSGNTAIWFASGIGFLAVYIFGYKIWPAILIGASFINLNFLVLDDFGFTEISQMALAASNGLNNTFSAVLGVYLIRRLFGETPLFSTIRLTTFFIVTALFVSLFSSSLGSFTFALYGKNPNFYSTLLTWWLSDAAGLIMIVPLVLSWKKPEYSFTKLRNLGLLASFILLLVFVGIFIFHIGYHIAYLFLPFFIYFTYRFGRFFSLFMAFVLSLVSVAVVIYLHNYWLWNTSDEGLFYVRLFLLILLLTILLVAAVIDEQNALDERMRIYKKIIDSSNDGIVVYDPHGYYLEQNPAHEQLTGFTKDELKGKTPAIHLGEEAFEIISKDLSEQHMSVGEWNSTTKNGIIPIEISAFNIFNEDNQIICHAAIERDISERKHAENLIKKSEAEAWSLFEYAAIPIMIEDFSEIKKYIDKLKAAGLTDWESYFEQNPTEIKKLAKMVKVVDINTRMIAFYGEESKDQLINNIAGFFNEESYLVFKEEIIALAEGSLSFSSLIPIVTLNQEVRQLIISISVPPIYSANLERVLVSFVDITETKKNQKTQQILLNISNSANKAKNIEETLFAIQSELEGLLDISNFFLAVYSEEKDELSFPFIKDEKYFTSHQADCKSLTSFVIKQKKPLLLSDKDIIELTNKGIIEAISAPAKISLAVPIKIKGTVKGAFVIQNYTTPFALAESEMETFEFIANQIALTIERKQAEEEILQALERARESDRIKSAFLASMSHELRTPLNAIIGFSDLIDEDFPHEQLLQITEMINKSGRNLLEIVDSIFEVTLLGEGNQELNCQPHVFSELMNDINQTVLTRQNLLNKSGVNVVVEHQVSPIKEIITDREKFKHIFLNLLSNALKFTYSGTIKYGLEDIDDAGNLHFYVSDTGIGIPKEKQEIIFERFRMADDTHNRKHEGMGIGLFVCRKLIALFGGEIYVESEENLGSCFRFYLPLQINK